MLEGYHLQEQELPSLPQIDITQPDSLRHSRKFKDLSSFEQLAHHIFEYSRKTLTYETDGLNAFRGLLSRAQLHTFYGVPLFTYGDQRVAIDSNTHFDLGFAVGLFVESSKRRNPADCGKTEAAVSQLDLDWLEGPVRVRSGGRHIYQLS
jgi:hypothetical protein